MKQCVEPTAYLSNSSGRPPRALHSYVEAALTEPGADRAHPSVFVITWRTLIRDGLQGEVGSKVRQVGV